MEQTLHPGDVVGGSFWLLSIAMIAAGIFVFLERKNVAPRWHTTMVATGVVLLISAIHYYYMRELWVNTATAPIVLRYVDWLLSTPLQTVLFYLIISVIVPVSGALFWRLLIGALVMVIAQFLGAAGYMSGTLGFLIGLVGWLYILGELYMGEAAKANVASGNVAVNSAYNSLRLIVTIGWAMYHFGYFTEHLGGGINNASLNVIYNLADFLNKIIFCLVIYRIAVKDTATNKR